MIYITSKLWYLFVFLDIVISALQWQVLDIKLLWKIILFSSIELRYDFYSKEADSFLIFM